MYLTGVVTNPPVSVIGISGSVLTLAALPAGFVAPTAADPVYAYGPLVPVVSTALLGVCNSLGPSRASGFGDPLTSWQDTLTISALITAAQGVIDVDGTPMVDELPVDQLTIDGAVADVRGIDSALGPELLYLSSIAVVAG
jgi:hypothetical protein